MIGRRQFLRTGAGLAVLSVLASCSTEDGTTPSASGKGAGADAAGAFPRSVQHELGETEVVAAPQRVVCGTDGAELCSVLALGVTPVGFGQRNDPLPPWLRERAAGIDSYDLSSGETSYEALIAWAPDLVLVQVGFATEETLPRFTDVAPTIATSFVDWRANLRQVGSALGRDEEARRLETETDDAVAARATALAADLGDLSDFRLNAVTAFTDGSIYAFNAESPLGKVAESLGLAPLPPARTSGEAVDQISREELDLLDGDLLLVMTFDDGPNGNVDLAGSGLWQRLKVVADGGTVDVGPDESNQLYFDSVLTVEPNAAVLDRLVRERLA